MNVRERYQIACSLPLIFEPIQAAPFIQGIVVLLALVVSW